MSNIGDRIKVLRKDLKITQDAFAARINLSRNYITQMELGNRVPAQRTIADICREFNVSEAWLTDGVEPMYMEAEDSDWEMITRIMAGASENKKKLMRILADMPDELLDKMVDYLEAKYTK